MTNSILRPDAARAAEEWSARVRANREQVEQFRESGFRNDFYAPMARQFAADPRRTGDSVLDALLELTAPDQTWIDIGAGGGRYTLPIALRVKSITAVEPSAGMQEILQQGATDYSISNLELIPERWPLPEPPGAHTAFISNVGYDVEEIGPFLDAMDACAERRVAILMNHPPTTFADNLWPAVHGVPRATLPSLPEFLVLLGARGHDFEVRFIETLRQTYPEIGRALTFARWQTWVAEGSQKDRRLEQALRENLIESEEGLVPTSTPNRVALVTW